MRMRSQAWVGFRRRMLWALVAVVALTIGACGSASSSRTTTGTSGVQYQARLNLAKCFRAHGINVPDPTSGGGPAGGGETFRILRNYPLSQLNAARQACQQYIAQAFPQANLSPAQRAQFRQQLVKFTKCMRSHGIDIPDPTFNDNGPGAGFGIRRSFRSIDRNSPAFQAANQACSSLRPRFGRFGGGGGGGGAPAPAAP